MKTCPPNISSEVQLDKDLEIVMEFHSNLIEIKALLNGNDITVSEYNNNYKDLVRDFCTKIRNNK